MLKKEIPSADCSISENGINIRLTIEFSKDLSVFENNMLSVYIRSYENGIIKLIIIPSAVEKEDISAAVSALKAALL